MSKLSSVDCMYIPKSKGCDAGQFVTCTLLYYMQQVKGGKPTVSRRFLLSVSNAASRSRTCLRKTRVWHGQRGQPVVVVHSLRAISKASLS